MRGTLEHLTGEATVGPDGTVTGRISFDARPLTHQEATAQAAILTAELEVDRTEFDMTWSPLHIASTTAHGTVKARFVRA